MMNAATYFVMPVTTSLSSVCEVRPHQMMETPTTALWEDIEQGKLEVTASASTLLLLVVCLIQ